MIPAFLLDVPLLEKFWEQRVTFFVRVPYNRNIPRRRNLLPLPDEARCELQSL